MARETTTEDVPGLLERGRELELAGEALAAAREGRGAALWIEGPAGIGKSALLDAVASSAADHRMAVLRARGSELMRDLPFGVALGLLDRELRRQGGRAGALLNDLLVPAGPPDRTSAATPERELSLVYGLSWLVAELAESRPVLLVVDDAHWADRSSLRFLLYLRQRLEELHAVVAIAARPAEPDAAHDLLRSLSAHPGTTRLIPAALSGGAVEALVRARHPAAGARFCTAIARLTGGTPFLVRELLAAAAADGGDLSDEAVARLDQLAPRPVVESVLERLARLGPGPHALARSVAILGEDAALRHASALARVDQAAAAVAADALAAAAILVPGDPLAFVHPLVRSAVYSDIPAAQRAELHRRAARLLAAEGAPAQRCAAQLLVATSTGDGWVVEELLRAARQASEQGAPASAVAFLRRALEEPPAPSDRRGVLMELAEAEAAAGLATAPARLEEALALAAAPDERARTLERLGWSLYRGGRLAESYAAFERALEQDAIADDLSARVRTAQLGVGAILGEVAPEELHELLETGGEGNGSAACGREQQVQLATASVFTAQPHARALALAESALADGAMLAEEGVSFAFSAAVSVLFWCDALESAERAIEAALEHARASGDLLAIAYVLFGRAQPRFWRGEVAAAAADAEVAVRADAGGWSPQLAMSRYWQAMSLLELDDLDGAGGALGGLDLAWPLAQQAVWHAGRGRLALARGDAAAAWEALAAAEQLAVRVPFLHNATGYAWRPDAAIAAAGAGEAKHAQRLADEELALSRRFGAPRPLGVAVRAAGLVAGGERGVELLREAVSVLERSPSELERCRALVDLGAALRRTGARAEARAVLRRGLDLAQRRGALALERRADAELRASGARPRRRPLSGPQALTPSERRVAELAAQGLTNAAIAQLLFVRRKTVEWHLHRAYAKLGIGSRELLERALAD